MDFGKNVLANNVSPTTLDEWEAANVKVEGNKPDSYFVLTKDSSMHQTISSTQLNYSPRQLRLELISTPSDSITYYYQLIRVVLKVRYVNGTFQNITAVLTPTRNVDTGKLKYINNIDINNESSIIDIKLFILPHKMGLGSYCHIHAIYLQPSIDLDPQTLDAIQTKLPSMIYYSNKRVISDINSTQINIAHMSLAMAGNANLNMSFFMQGQINFGEGVPDNPYVELFFLLNNKQLVFSSVKVPALSKLFVVGLPLPLLQVPSGSNTVSIEAKCNNCSLTIPKENLQVTIDGRNIEGGYSAEPPHAEIREDLNRGRYVELFNDNRNKSKLTVDIKQQKPLKNTIKESITSTIINGSKYKTIKDSLNIRVVRHGELITLNKSNITFTLDKDIDVNDYGTYVIYEHITKASDITVDSGKAFAFKIDTADYRNIEEVKIK